MACIALVVALGGGAYAASGGLTGKQKKEVKKIAKEVAGAPGAPGAPGQAGPAGPQGSEGRSGRRWCTGWDWRDRSHHGTAVPLSISYPTPFADPSGKVVFPYRGTRERAVAPPGTLYVFWIAAR